jgi:hypothetical protein
MMLWQAMGAPTCDPFAPSAEASQFSPENSGANYLSTQYLIGNTAGLATTPTLSSALVNATATLSKVARTDGIAGDWQQTVYSCTANNAVNQIRTSSLPTPSGGFPAAYTDMRLLVEVEVSGGACLMPEVQLSALVSGAMVRNVKSSAPALSSQNLPITPWAGVLKTPPLRIMPADQSLEMLLRAVGANGTTSAQVRFGRCVICAD